MLDLRQLESFVAIVRHGSFTKAAEELYLSQPTLTGHIQSLENKLGTVLLNRNGKTVTLTDAGVILYRHAVNMLNTRELALFSLAQYKGKLQGELAIASSTVPQSYILPKLLTAFSKRYPNITYTIDQNDSKGVVDAINSGVMDFGFVGTDVNCPKLEVVKLCSGRLVVITSSQGGWLESNENTISWEQIKDQNFIFREEGSGNRALFEAALKEKGVALHQLKVIATIANPDTIKQCVMAGLGITVISELAVQDEVRSGLLKGLFLSDLHLEQNFYLISHKNRVLSPVARAFREFTLDYIKAP